MNEAEAEALVRAFERPPYNRYRGWRYCYEYPGLFAYSHERLPVIVYFTPEYENPNEISLEIWREAAEVLEKESIPYFNHTPEDLFAIVRQWLDFAEWNITRRKSVKDWSPGGVPWIPRGNWGRT